MDLISGKDYIILYFTRLHLFNQFLPWPVLIGNYYMYVNLMWSKQRLFFCWKFVLHKQCHTKVSAGLPILALNRLFLKIKNASNLLKIHDFSFKAAFTNRKSLLILIWFHFCKPKSYIYSCKIVALQRSFARH